MRSGEFFGVVGRNGSGKSTLLKCLAGIYGVDSGAIEIAGALSPFIELGVGFNPDLTARDNVLINADHARASPRKEARRALRRDHRVRRARGVHRPQAQELLVGHGRAAGVLRGDPGRRRHPARRRGAGRRRRRLPAEVLRPVRPHEGARGGRSCSSPTTWARSSASATARCCSRRAACSRSASRTAIARRYNELNFGRAACTTTPSGTARRPAAARDHRPAGSRTRPASASTRSRQGEPLPRLLRGRVPRDRSRTRSSRFTCATRLRHTVFVTHASGARGDRRLRGRRARSRPSRSRTGWRRAATR